MPDRTWRVVVETRELNGNPFHNIYGHVPGDTAEEAIDYALKRFLGNTGGRNSLLDHWRPVAAWAVDEEHVSDLIPIEPISQPLYQRGSYAS